MIEISQSSKSFNINIDSLMKDYRENQMMLSPLSFHEYKHVQNRSFPTLQIIQQAPPKLKLPFLPFQDINQISQTAVNELSNSLRHSKSRWNQFKSVLFKEKKFVTETAECNLHLQHNKQTLESIRELSKVNLDQEFYKISKTCKKMETYDSKKVKIYPSRVYKEAQKLEMLQRKLGGPEVIENQQVHPQNEQKNEIHFHLFQNITQRQMPNSREGSTFITSGNEIFLYGGLGVQKSDELLVAKKELFYYNWSTLNIKTDSLYHLRCGHSANYYKNQIIIFGGELHYIKNGKSIKEFTNELKIFNIQTNEVKIIKSGMIETRSGHISFLVGKNLVFFGGINSRGQFLKDLIILDLTTFKWIPADFVQKGFFENGISDLGACLVTSQFNKFIELYRKDEDQIPHYGLYIFGGQDSKGIVHDRLVVLHIDTKPMYFEQVITQGKMPEGRYKHSMLYSDMFNIIILCGGMNNGFLNDICVLSMRNLTWLNVQMTGLNFEPRSSHAAILYDTQMLIFGGFNENGYLSADLLIVEFDSTIAKSMDHKEKEKCLKKDELIIQKQERKDLAAKVMEEKLQKKRINELIQSLQCKNMKSFLPMPRKNSSFQYQLRNSILISPLIQLQSVRNQKQTFD